MAVSKKIGVVEITGRVKTEGFADAKAKLDLIVVVARRTAEALDQVFERGEKMRNMMRGLAIDVSKAEAATQGLVSRFTLVQAAALATTAEVKLTSSEFAELTRQTAILAQKTGRDVPSSIRRMIDALAKQERELLDELGITVSATEAKRKFARAHRIAVSEMTAAQQKMAFQVEVLEQLKRKTQGSTLAIDSAGAAWKKLKTNADNAFTAVSQWVNKSDIIRRALLSIASAASTAARAFRVLTGSSGATLDDLKGAASGLDGAAQSALGNFGLDASKIRDQAAAMGFFGGKGDAIRALAIEPLAKIQAHRKEALAGARRFVRLSGARAGRGGAAGLGGGLFGALGSKVTAGERSTQQAQRIIERKRRARRLAARIAASGNAVGDALAFGTDDPLGEFTGTEPGAGIRSERDEVRFRRDQAKRRRRGQLISLFGRGDETGGASEKSELAELTRRNKEFEKLSRVTKDIDKSFMGVAKGGLAAFTTGMGEAIAAAVTGQKSFGEAFTAMTKAVLGGIAKQALVKAGFYAAEGLAALFVPGMQAASGGYFAAAGKMAAVAALAGSLGAAISSGSASGSGSQSASSGASAPDTRGFGNVANRDEERTVNVHVFFGERRNEAPAIIMRRSARAELAA